MAKPQPKPVTMLCTYRPKPGKEAEMLAILKGHWATLDRVGLVTKQPATLYRATGRDRRQYFVEIFQWRDGEAAGIAHQTPDVMAVWEPIGTLAESMSFDEIETA